MLGIVTGPRVLAEAIARRLSTPRGGLFYDPTYGLDVRAWLNESLTPQRLFALRHAVEAEVEKDERVLSCSADLTFIAATKSLRLTLSIQTQDGPFALVLGVISLTVSILSIS